MKKILKAAILLIMLLGITISLLNIASIESNAIKAGGGPEGTIDDGECVGAPLNC